MKKGNDRRNQNKEGYMFKKFQKPINLIGALGVILGGFALYSNEGSCQPCTCLLAFKSEDPDFPGSLIFCLPVGAKHMTNATCKQSCAQHITDPNVGPFSACWGNKKWAYCNQTLKNPKDIDRALTQSGCTLINS